jgi:hypothetical protein
LSCVYTVCCLIVVSVLFVCCLIVVPLPPGENPFAVNNNNNTGQAYNILLVKGHDNVLIKITYMFNHVLSTSGSCIRWN